MMSNVKDIFKEWSPRQLWPPIMIFLVTIMILKLLVFDILWCSATSLSCMANPLVYIHVILLSFILSSPFGMFHRKWVQVGVLFAVDIWLVASLLCNVDGLVSIPLLQYLLMGALPEAMENTPRFLEWACLFFPLTSVAAVWMCLRNKGRTPVPVWGKLQYAGYLLAWSVLACIVK